jgi:hypothetical protein
LDGWLEWIDGGQRVKPRFLQDRPTFSNKNLKYLKVINKLTTITLEVNGMRRILLVLLTLIVSVTAISGTGMGAALTVDGVATPAMAAPENSYSAVILLSVTDQNGAAVRRLGSADFKIDAPIVAPNGAKVDIKNVLECPDSPGFYLIDIAPGTDDGTQYTWKAGTYLLTITVGKATTRGQAVVALQVASSYRAAGIRGED